MFLLLRGFLLTSSPSLFTLNLKSAFSRGFSFRKLQILISQTTDFHFVLLHFVSQTTVSQFGGTAWFSLESCSIYAFAFTAINHRLLVCKIKFEIKCFALRSNAFWFKNKSVTNNYIKEKPKYVSIPLFWLLPWTKKKNEADQHDPRHLCEKCKHLKLKLSGSSLVVELLLLLLSSDSLSPLSSLKNSCTFMSDKSTSTFTTLKLKLLLLSLSEPKIAWIRRRPYW